MKLSGTRCCWAVAAVAAIAMLVLPSSQADAAVVASTGTNDKMRCGTAGVDMASSDYFIGRCYYDVSNTNVSNGFTPGADVVLQGVVASSRGYFTCSYWTVGAAVSNNCGANSSGETVGSMAYVGPQTQYPFGFIPRGAVVFQVRLPGTGSYSWANFALTGTPTTMRTNASAIDGRAYNDRSYNASYTALYNRFYWGGVASSPAAAYNSVEPPDTFTAGQATFQTPQCPGVTVTGPPFGTVASAGSTQTFTVARSGGSTVTNFGIRARILGGGVTWAFNPWTTGTSFTVPVVVEGGVPVKIEAFEFRCSVDNGASYQYQLYGAPGAWFGFGQDNRPCAAVTVAWPGSKADTYTVGQSIDFTLSTPTGTSNVAVRYYLYDFPTAETPQLNNVTWIDLANPLVGGTPQDVSVLAAYATTAEQVLLRCEDSMGFYSGQTLSSGYVYGLYGEVDTETCYQSAKIGVNPVSWVPGLARMVVCAGKNAALELFVPDENVTAEFRTDVGDALNEHAPTNYVVTLVPLAGDIVSGLDDSLESHRLDSLTIFPEFTLPGETPAVVDEQVLDPEDLPTESLLRPLLLVLLWWGFASFMWKLVAAILNHESMMGIIGSVGRVDPGTATEGELNRRRVMGYQG